MATENQDKTRSTSGEEVVSPSTPSAMNTDSINLGYIEVLQILNEYGEVDAGLEPDLSDSTLMDIYRSMVLARVFDQRMLTMQRQGRMGTFARILVKRLVSSGKFNHFQTLTGMPLPTDHLVLKFYGVGQWST